MTTFASVRDALLGVVAAPHTHRYRLDRAEENVVTHLIDRCPALLAALLICAPLAGCDKTADAAGAPSAKPSASAAPVSSASAAPSAASAAPAAPGLAADWVDLDLTPGGKYWADYTLKGPAGAKIKKGTPDPEIEAGDYGLVLSVQRTKKSTAGLDTARAYGVSWRPLTDTPELFEYETSGVQDGEKFVRYNFSMFVKVDGKTVGCSGLNNQKEREKLAPMMAACRTLRKK